MKAFPALDEPKPRKQIVHHAKRIAWIVHFLADRPGALQRDILAPGLIDGRRQPTQEIATRGYLAHMVEQGLIRVERGAKTSLHHYATDKGLVMADGVPEFQPKAKVIPSFKSEPSESVSPSVVGVPLEEKS